MIPRVQPALQADEARCRAFLRSTSARVYYGDGPPVWFEGKDNRPAKTAEKAETERATLVRLLRRADLATTESELLADLLAACSAAWRCGEAACPICARAFQRHWVVGLQESFSQPGGWCISIVPGDQIPIGSLQAKHFRDFNRSVCRVLQKTKVCDAIGGIDINVSERDPASPKPYYRMQAYLLVPSISAAQEQLLRASFASPSVRVGVWLDKFDGDPRALAYTLKADFVRRQTIPRSQALDGSWRRQNTRNRPLKRPDEVELACVRQQLGFCGRLILPKSTAQVSTK